MNFFKGFWLCWAGGQYLKRVAAKKSTLTQNIIQTETVNTEPDDGQYCDDYFEADEFIDWF